MASAASANHPIRKEGAMLKMVVRSRFGPALLGGAAVGAAVLVAGASPAFAQGAALEGVWAIVTQERNCSTGAAIGPTTRAMVTYNAGGTLTESTSIPVFAVGQRSDGHGTWNAAGPGRFSARTATMILFDTAPGTPPFSPGFQAGWQVATNVITLSGPNAFTAVGSSQFYDVNRVFYRQGCVTRTGERFR
jgi:hypothetical protein